MFTIPDNWTLQPLESLLKAIGDGGTPDTSKSEYFNGDIPWVVISDIKDQIFKTKTYLTKLGISSSSAKLWPKNTIILSTGATIGEVGIAKVELATKQGIHGIVCNEKVLSSFLFYKFQTLRNFLNANAQGSTIREVRAPFLRKIPILFPNSLLEQSKIAEILSTVDQTIENTEALISKHQRIITGLMQDLLTRGIDEYGNIRSEETHKFKDSPLGRIPVEWDVFSLKELGNFKNGVNKPKEEFGFGTLFVNILDVYSDYLNIFSLERLNVSKSEIEIYKLEGGDILIDRSSVKLEGVGYPTVFIESDEPVIFCGFIIRFRPTASLNSRFMCLQMRSESFRIEVFKVATKSANVNINQESLGKLQVLFPSLDEQERIVRIELALNSEINNLINLKHKLKSLKIGLMQDLLSGNMRVTSLLENQEGIP